MLGPLDGGASLPNVPSGPDPWNDMEVLVEERPNHGHCVHQCVHGPFSEDRFNSRNVSLNEEGTVPSTSGCMMLRPPYSQPRRPALALWSDILPAIVCDGVFYLGQFRPPFVIRHRSTPQGDLGGPK